MAFRRIKACPSNRKGCTRQVFYKIQDAVGSGSGPHRIRRTKSIKKKFRDDRDRGSPVAIGSERSGWSGGRARGCTMVSPSKGEIGQTSGEGDGHGGRDAERKSKEVGLTTW